MADVYLDMNYKIDVNEKQMRLICLALAGRLTRSEDIAAAQVLNVRLLQGQNTRIKEKITMLDGALKRANEEVKDPAVEDTP